MKNKRIIVSSITIVLILIIIAIIHILTPRKVSIQFTIKSYETVLIEDLNMKIHLSKIVDSRCKDGFECITAGELSYTLRTTHNNKKKDIVLTSVHTPKTQIDDNYIIEIISSNEKEVTLKVY